MNGAAPFILKRQWGCLDAVDPEYGDGVRAALAATGQPLEEPVAGD
jgi:hypothetical protein